MSLYPKKYKFSIPSVITGAIWILVSLAHRHVSHRALWSPVALITETAVGTLPTRYELFSN